MKAYAVGCHLQLVTSISQLAAQVMRGIGAQADLLDGADNAALD